MSELQHNAFKVKLFQAAMGLANRLASLPDKLVPPPFRLIEMGSAYWQSRALYVAAELGVADTLGDAEKGTAQIAAELELHEDHLCRLLRMLTSLGVFEETGERRFRNSRLSAYLRRDHPRSVRALILLHNSPEISTPWYESLGPAIRTGEVPFVLSHGEELFAFMNSHPEFDTRFTAAMEAVDGLTGTDYLHDFDWGRFDRLIDVGGSNGKKSIAILRSHPQLHALVFDRPRVVADAADHWRDRLEPSLLARIDLVGGDMLEAIPAATSNRDVYLFAAVFHAMDDEEAGKVLANLRKACGEHHPTIVIADAVAQAHHVDPIIASFDMQMLVGTRGRERTLAEWRALLGRKGFALRELVEVRTFAKLLVVRDCP